MAEFPPKLELTEKFIELKITGIASGKSKSKDTGKEFTWHRYDVVDTEGQDYGWFVGGKLLVLLQTLELGKGDSLEARSYPVKEEGEYVAHYEIKAYGKTANTQTKESVQPVQRPNGVGKIQVGGLGEPHPDIDLALDRYKYLVLGLRKKILEIQKELELKDEQVNHLFDKSHIQTLLNNLGR